ncbi:DNA repair protein RecO [Candidatus Deianiraea vastatrix]|uniref:DNA repair protein RecO n=1 Tax=Candidatus Deianiraea vastatrix TaxID=2163644 RepID=A0A5B8XEJ9_9RICK|nr:DNA repair protein RecO [Candidatus Deianiraea vastatrix]QED23693.1 DNA repair protein RecO [Candidatus Deianiraea vastatrix]
MNGKAIIIHCKKLNENDAFVKLLSSDGQIIRGFCKSALSRKNSQICQISNLVDFAWQGRENSLGLLKIQNIKSYSSLILHSKIATLSTLSIIEILNSLIDENHTYKHLYTHLLDFLSIAIQHNQNDICFEYIKLELAFLVTTGYHTISQIKQENTSNINLLSRIFSKYNKPFPSSRNILENIIVKTLENNNLNATITSID